MTELNNGISLTEEMKIITELADMNHGLGDKIESGVILGIKLCGYNVHDAEAIYQQILNNQAIVECIHSMIKDYEQQRKQAYFPSKKRGMLYKKIKYLRGILSSTEHSLGSSESKP